LLRAVSTVPKPFDIVLVDDTSRLSRNIGDAVRAFEQLNFAGIRIVAVSQGIDTQNEQADVLMTVHGLVDSLYIKELSKKTHRGLEGRALHGLHTGGRCFGYTNITTPEGVRLQVNESEAVIVRDIFRMAADGISLRGIAKRLNAQGIPPARPRAGKRYATWCPSAIRSMLRRDLYAGTMIWNKSRFIKEPGTNKRLRRARPQTDWRTVQNESLRIIDQPLWQRVQARLAEVQETYGYAGLERGPNTSYLLTGFLRCGTCGANMVIVTGRGKQGQRSYGCPQNYYRGACKNNLKERQDHLEAKLLSGLQTSVLQSDAIEYALVEFQRQLAQALSTMEDDLGRARDRKVQLERELANLIGAIATTGHSPSIATAIGDRERELRTITEHLLGNERQAVAPQLSDLREFVTDRLTNIRALITSDVDRARAELTKHVTLITLQPQRDHYVAEGDWNLLGKQPSAAEREGGEKRVWMVAGAYFEAIHNALGALLMRRWHLPKNGRRPPRLSQCP
jgi:DNA invertase Pin-like site-specific DNA recombinase